MYISIDDQNSAQDHRNIELYYLHSVFDLRMNSQQRMYCFSYYYVDQSNGISIVRLLFENQYFVRQRLKFQYIIEVDQLLVTLENNGQAAVEHVGRTLKTS